MIDSVSLLQNEVFNVNFGLGNRFQRLKGLEKIVLGVSDVLQKGGLFEFTDIYFNI